VIVPAEAHRTEKKTAKRAVAATTDLRSAMG
jgi:hypothetical protein